jgi:hypothetical protein
MERGRERPDIQGAIERSRSARAARRRRRRRLVLLACASVLLGGGTALSIAGFDAGDAVEAAVGQAQNFAQLLGQRSPGTRTTAELTKTKRAQRSLADQIAPPLKTEWFAPQVPNSVKLANILLPPAGDIVAPIAILEEVPPPPPGFIIPPPGGGDLIPPGGSTIVPPGGSTNVPPPGGIIGTPPGDDTHVTFPKDEKEIIPVAAVPEPGTWAMMLLGFALIGWQLRRQAGRAAGRRLA